MKQIAEAEGKGARPRYRAVRVEYNAWKAARLQAFEEDRTVGEFLTAALDEYLAKRNGNGKRRAT